MVFDIQAWYNTEHKGSDILSFMGEVDSEVITQLLDRAEERLVAGGESPKQTRKIYNVLVEALQNLFHHVEGGPGQLNYSKHFGCVIINEMGDQQYRLITGNFVRKDRIKFLKDRLDQINYLSKDELKSLYRMILDNQEFSRKGGGGLGMIDIARKTGSKIDYKFHNFDETYYFYTFAVNI